MINESIKNNLPKKNSKLINQNKTAKIKLQNICSICENLSHGIHFGVKVCRACAAFFRRSILTKREYICRNNGNCKIGKDMRCSCRACRMKKCINFGMYSTIVQRRQHKIKTKQKNIIFLPNIETNFNYNKKSIIEKTEIKQTTKNIEKLSNNYKNNLTAINSIGTNNWSPFSVLYSKTNDLSNYIEKINAKPTNQQTISLNYPIIQESAKTYTLLSSIISDALPSTSTNINNDNLIIKNSEAYKKNGQISTDTNLLNIKSGTLMNTSTSNFDTKNFHNLTTTNSAFTPIQNNEPTTDDNLVIVDETSPITSATTKIIKSAQILNNIPTNISLLNEIDTGYKKFLALRRTSSLMNQNATIYRLLAHKVELKLATYTDDLLSLKTDLSLISEFINNHFIPVSNFSIRSKWIMFRNSFCPIILVDRSYNTAKLFSDKNDKRIFISPYLYMDLTKMVDFFNVEHCKVSPHKMANIFEITFNKVLNLITNLFRELNVTDSEFAGLLGLLFWNHKNEELLDAEVKIVEQTKISLYNELYNACAQNATNSIDYGIRFAKLCNVITHSYRISSEFSGSFSLVKALNSFDVDTFLYNFMPNTW